MSSPLLEVKDLQVVVGEENKVLLDGLNLTVNAGETHVLMGHNGAGKSTLMSALMGDPRYTVTRGQIIFRGQDITHETADVRARAGMFLSFQTPEEIPGITLESFLRTAAGAVTGKPVKVMKFRREMAAQMEALNMDPSYADRYLNVGFSGGEKKKAEILQLLMLKPALALLDETDSGLDVDAVKTVASGIKAYHNADNALIIITHKLHEVLSISDRVAILRKGEYVGDIATKDANEAKLTEMMVGEKVELNIERPEPVNPVKRLDIEHLTVRSAEGITVLDDASFPVYGGEILGIAGISGNGQKELLEAIAGLQPAESGASIEYYAPDAAAPVQLVGKSPKAIREAGIHLSFVPEDRLGMGLVGSMGMTDNMMLKSYGKGHSPIVDRKAPLALAETIKKELGVVTPDLNTPVSRLSGGNVQKVLVGRELAADPIVLMTAYAVRGLDINTSYTIYHLLNEQKKRGVAVIYVGEDLDVLLELCDRIVVLCGGKVNGILDGRKTTKEEVGLRMTNLVKEEQA